MRHLLGEADLEEGGMRGYRLSGDRFVLLVRLDGRYHALDDQCNHAGCLLSGGRLRSFEVECPCHQMTFDVRSGALTAVPRLCRDQRSYPVEVASGRVYVDL